LLSSLLDKSLLRWESGPEGNGRYQIHELLRQYAAEKLLANPKAAAETPSRHAHYYLSLLDQRLDDLLGGRQMEVMLEIEAELNNIRAAWQWAVEHEEWAAIKDAMETLHLFCDMQGRHLEGIAIFQLACKQLSLSANIETRPLLGRLLSRYRFLQVYAPVSPEEMEEDLLKSLTIAREQDNHLETAVAFLALGGFTFYVRGDPGAAMALFVQSLPLFRAQNHALYEARTLGWIGTVHPEREGSVRYFRESLDVARACGDKMDMLISLSNLAEMALSDGDYAVAKAYCDETIATADEMRFRVVTAHTRTLLSLVYFLRGEWATATTLAQEGLAHSKDLNNGMAIAYAEGIVGLYASMAGNYAQGRQFGESSRANPANHELGLVTMNWGLATAYCGLQAYDAAWEVAREGIRLAQAADSTAMMMWLLPVTSILLHRQGKSILAVKLLALTSAHPLSQTGWMGQCVLLREMQDELKRELETAVHKAETLSPDGMLDEIEAIFLVPFMDDQVETSGLEMDPVFAANQSLVEPLTNRELEVLQLIAVGLTNRQIADKLVISTGTVKYYSSHIYGKLQVSNRTQAVSHARELGILQI